MGRWQGIIATALALAVATGFAVGDGAAEDRKPYAEMKDVQPHDALAPCSARLPPLPVGRLDAGKPAGEALKAALGAERYLGVDENIRLRTEGNEPFLRVRYPKGSVNFSSADDDTPLGGASFYAPFSRAQTTCLHYKVRFPEGFEFVKGGKLPGLYAGKAPSGGQEVTGHDGWSVRLMWRKEGKGELYEYVYNKKGKYGLSVGRGRFTFPTGRWIAVDLEVVANDPGERNGRARLWIDGKPVIEQDNIVYATDRNARAEGGLMFSTFFGGNSKSWASPKDQHVDFADFRFYAGGNDG